MQSKAETPEPKSSQWPDLIYLAIGVFIASASIGLWAYNADKVLVESIINGLANCF